MLKHFVLATIVSCSFATRPAQADFVVQVHRLSDSMAVISGTGVFPANIGESIDLLGATNGGDGVSEGLSDNMMTIGASTVTDVLAVLGTMHFRINFSPEYSTNDVLSGSIKVTLNNETWAPVGTTGEIFNNRSESIVGTYSVVPEPSAFLYGGLISVLAGCSCRIKWRKGSPLYRTLS